MFIFLQGFSLEDLIIWITGEVYIRICNSYVVFKVKGDISAELDFGRYVSAYFLLLIL